MIDTLVERVRWWAQAQPEHLAVAFKKETLSYGQLWDSMTRVGRILAEMGVKQGDKVLICAISRPEFVAAYLGIQYAGGVAVFVDRNATPENAFGIYQDAQAVLFLTDKPMKEYADRCWIYPLKGILQTSSSADDAGNPKSSELGRDRRGCSISVYEKPEDEAPAEILYTSGTTGVPKGVILAYRSVYHIWENTIEGIGIRHDDRLLLPLPLNHSFALRNLRAYLACGATVILQSGFTFAKDIENNVDTYNCTAIAVVPASVETISRQMQNRFPEIMGRFRYIEAGAGSLTVAQRKCLVKQLPGTVIYNTWGSSESGGVFFCNVAQVAGDPVKVATIGSPLDCVQVQTLDEQGKPFSSDHDHPGRMAVKGEMVMAGYHNQPELTAETLKDGWFVTSDMVYMDEDGCVYMLGRADDIINVGGEKVSPIEVENTAREYEHLRECACIGVPDPDGILGFVPVLFVVKKDDLCSEAELARFLADRMERYKLPVRYVYLTELPRNAMKKLDRRALRKLWEGLDSGADDLQDR